MSQTYPFDTSDPDSTLVDAKDIGAEIRQVKIMMQEILNQLMGKSEATAIADPVVDGSTIQNLTQLTSNINGKITGSSLITGKGLVATGAASIGNHNGVPITSGAQVVDVNNEVMTVVTSGVNQLIPDASARPFSIIMQTPGGTYDSLFIVSLKSSATVALGNSGSFITWDARFKEQDIPPLPNIVSINKMINILFWYQASIDRAWVINQSEDITI